jgi:hypothetical protein
VNRRLRRTAAALFVVAAALFAVGVNAESDSHSESGDAVHNEAPASAGHDEAAEPVGHDEAAEAREAAEGDGAEAPVAAETHSEQDESEEVLGVDIESPAAVVAAVIVSLVLAVGLWLRNRRWLALVSVGFAVVFVVFDIAEIVHQLDESRTGLAVLATVIAGAHVAAATTAGISTRTAGRP